MKGNSTLFKIVCAFILLFAGSAQYSLLRAEPSQAQVDAPADSGVLRQFSEGMPTNQVIIKYRDEQLFTASQAAQTAQMARLSAQAGVALAYARLMSGEAHVLRLPDYMPLAEVERIAAQLRALPEVEYAEPDYIMQPALEPNDSRYSNQWHYFAQFGIDLPQAWEITTGDSNIVVAVIDTGHRPHVDLASRIVGGYDFVSNLSMANDGDGRDADAQDPGDAILLDDQSLCPLLPWPSSWHGTHVAGTIGAVTNNGEGVAGVNWKAGLLSVRVLGECGGFMSDIADGMRWAAGLHVPDVPANENPAKVLNLSLGGLGSCPDTYQSTIDEVNAAGAVVVAAAGNSNQDAADFTPANCDGVITVGATNSAGGRAGFSNYGSTVDVYAPGVMVLSTLNSGRTVPETDVYAYYQGTSMAAPHVAGVASLMLAINPTLNFTGTEAILKLTAKPLGVEENLVGEGKGIVSAHTALRYLKP